MSWPARTWVAGELVNDTHGNSYWRDPQNDLRAGGLAVSGQLANDFLHAATATQMGRVAVGTNKVPRFNGTAWEMVLPLELAWPVGSIYRAAVATNPATLIGVGTWAAFGTGRVTVSFDAGQAELDVVEETGGSKTHALVEAELPVHTHVQDSHNHTQDAHNHTQNSHTHDLTSVGDSNTVNGSPDDTSVLDNSGSITSSSVTATNQAATAVNQDATATNQSAGSGTAHTNLMPYIVCYCWKRTS